MDCHIQGRIRREKDGLSILAVTIKSYAPQPHFLCHLSFLSHKTVLFDGVFLRLESHHVCVPLEDLLGLEP